MPTTIERRTAGPMRATFATSAANSTSIPMSSWAAFAFVTPTGSTATTVTWFAAADTNGPYREVVLSNGVPATTAVVAERVYVAPPELFACTYIKGVADAAVTVTVMAKT